MHIYKETLALANLGIAVGLSHNMAHPLRGHRTPLPWLWRWDLEIFGPGLREVHFPPTHSDAQFTSETKAAGTK